jgi:hypothetical protein
MNVLTDYELRSGKRTAFVAGIVTTILWAVAIAALIWWLRVPARAPIGVPAILRQTPSQTVARIPTLRAGERIDCTVTIDQAKNIWSITC